MNKNKRNKKDEEVITMTTTTTMMMMVTTWQVACQSTQTAVWSSAMFVALTPDGINVDRAPDLLCRLKPSPFLTSRVSTNNSIY